MRTHSLGPVVTTIEIEVPLYYNLLLYQPQVPLAVVDTGLSSCASTCCTGGVRDGAQVVGV